MKKSILANLIILSMLILGTCKGPTEPDVAVVQILSLKVTGVPWGNSSYYDAEFQIVERGGVAIIVDSFRIDNYDAAGKNYAYINLDAVETMGGTSRILASQSRWGYTDFYDIENHAMAVKMKITAQWNDDNGNKSSTTATCNVVNLLPTQMNVSTTSRHAMSKMTND